mmetsp:Transcript_6481/g.24186  ORF Transcript_6481/g.24186 Transcript_6481/m.24186 type:complete len:227 (+) Transcript_6481:600-1280(+)
MRSESKSGRMFFLRRRSELVASMLAPSVSKNHIPCSEPVSERPKRWLPAAPPMRKLETPFAYQSIWLVSVSYWMLDWLPEVVNVGRPLMPRSLPILNCLWIEIAEPIWAKSRTAKAAPKRRFDGSDSAEPQLTKCSTETEERRRAMPTSEKADPMRATVRIDTDEPKLTKCITASAEDRRMNELKDRDQPRCASPRTDMEDARRATPNAFNDPRRPIVLSDNAEPI